MVVPKQLEVPKFWVEHIPFAFYLVPLLKPKLFVELGTHSGNSFFAFCQAVKENGLATKCYAVDIWKGDKHTGYYFENVYYYVAKHKEENYSDNAFLLRKTFDEALVDFQDGSIDLLHIDGLHTYEGVRHDFEAWLPKLSEKAVVLLHDTQIKMDDFGVWKYWKEISNRYPSFEFYHGCGLGVLAVGEKVPQEALQFINDAPNADKHRQHFEEEGKKVYELYKKMIFKNKLYRIFSIHRIFARRLKRLFS
jgi:O-antigen biosynthesis protein